MKILFLLGLTLQFLNWRDDEDGYEIYQNEVFSLNKNSKRFMQAPQVLNFDVNVDQANIENNLKNIQNILSIMNQKDWDFLFPLANKIYTFQNFLKAAAKFQTFCGEIKDTQDMQQTCKQELSTLFTHWTFETGVNKDMYKDISEKWRQGLFFTAERGCEYGNCQKTYNDCSGWIQKGYPCQKDQDYYGRGSYYIRIGPFQLSFNYNYGYFSKIYFQDQYVALKNPSLLSQNGTVSFASSIWFYMTPQYPKPSMHDVISGFWIPNESDQKANLTQGFGTTTNIINGGIECRGVNNQNQLLRAQIFQNFTLYFKLNIKFQNNLCQNQVQFPESGSGAIKQYWFKDPLNDQRCILGTLQTQYPLFSQTSYKECIKDT